MQCPAPERSDKLLRTLPSFRAVVMDMDGLALDTESTYCAAWERAAADLGFALSTDFCRELFGRHADDVKAALADACGPQLNLREFHARAERHWLAALKSRGVARMPGLDRLLGVLRAQGIPFALATNSDEPYAGLCLDAAGLQAAFTVVVTRDQVECGKPAPDVFLEAARRLGQPVGDCLALEDSPTGLSACIQAGMIPVWIPPPCRPVGPAPHDGVLVVRDLGELADRIEHRLARKPTVPGP